MTAEISDMSGEKLTLNSLSLSMGRVIPIEKNLEHSVSELICIDCKHRWIGVYPKLTMLKDLVCPNCNVTGTVIDTGQELFEDA